MTSSEEAILCFESVAQAIMAEQALVEQGFSVRVMPVPSGIRAGCGFCLRFLPEAIEKAAVFLAEQGLPVTDLYLFDGAGSYRKINGGTDGR